MATIEELEKRVAYLEAVEGVRRTVYEYLLLHDIPNVVEDLICLFTEDATLDISGYGESLEGRLVGRDEIGGLYRRLDAGGVATGKHSTTNVHIEIDGDEATVISYLDVGTGPKPGVAPGGGIYQERLRHEADGRWRFTHKRIIGTGEQTVHDAIDHSFPGTGAWRSEGQG